MVEWKEEKGVREDAKEEKKAESKVDVGMSDRRERVWTPPMTPTPRTALFVAKSFQGF